MSIAYLPTRMSDPSFAFIFAFDNVENFDLGDLLTGQEAEDLEQLSEGDGGALLEEEEEDNELDSLGDVGQGGGAIDQVDGTDLETAEGVPVCHEVVRIDQREKLIKVALEFASIIHNIPVDPTQREPPVTPETIMHIAKQAAIRLGTSACGNVVAEGGSVFSQNSCGVSPSAGPSLPVTPPIYSVLQLGGVKPTMETRSQGPIVEGGSGSSSRFFDLQNFQESNLRLEHIDHITTMVEGESELPPVLEDSDWVAPPKAVEKAKKRKPTKGGGKSQEGNAENGGGKKLKAAPAAESSTFMGTQRGKERSNFSVDITPSSGEPSLEPSIVASGVVHVDLDYGHAHHDHSSNAED